MRNWRYITKQCMISLSFLTVIFPSVPCRMGELPLCLFQASIMSTVITECSQSRIAYLASIIARNTTKIDGFLRSRDLPFPSFDIDAPLDFHFTNELKSARSLVVDATIELKELLLGPKELLLTNVVRFAMFIRLEFLICAKTKAVPI